MVSIWTWVGIVLSVYGVIVTGMGIYYIVVPETKTVLHALNPSLWWGLIMLTAGVIMLLLPAIGRALGVSDESETEN